MQNQTINTLVSNFAKANKISRVKLQTFADSIMATMPKQGRPMLDKTKAVQDQVIGYIKAGKASTIDMQGIDKVTLNNTIKALEKKGAIVRTGKVSTGKRGRQPVVYSLAQI